MRQEAIMPARLRVFLRKIFLNGFRSYQPRKNNNMYRSEYQPDGFVQVVKMLESSPGFQRWLWIARVCLVSTCFPSLLCLHLQSFTWGRRKNNNGMPSKSMLSFWFMPVIWHFIPFILENESKILWPEPENVGLAILPLQIVSAVPGGCLATAVLESTLDN